MSSFEEFKKRKIVDPYLIIYFNSTLYYYIILLFIAFNSLQEFLLCWDCLMWYLSKVNLIWETKQKNKLGKLIETHKDLYKSLKINRKIWVLIIIRLIATSHI